jgi:hypothetical protein
MPPIDNIQNVELLSSSEANGVTNLEFKRKLQACEPKDRSIEEGTTFVIYSYNSNDPDSENSIAKHQVAGRASVNLLSGTGSVEPGRLETDHKTVDLLNPNVTVPTAPTTYWCSAHMLPKLQNEAHIIRFEPIIQPNHEQLVHHVVMYECSGDLGPYVNQSYDCDSPDPSSNISPKVTQCRGQPILAAWAVGGLGTSFPSHVGLPMSGATGVQYVLLETHYNNEMMRSDYVDSSGLRLFYTATKRSNDGSIIEIGHFVSLFGWQLFLPPGLNDIVLENVCPGTCTQEELPSNGVNVFASFLHSHTAGKAITVKHSRKGQQLPDIDRNNNYDFDFQVCNI